MTFDTMTKTWQRHDKDNTRTWQRHHRYRHGISEADALRKRMSHAFWNEKKLTMLSFHHRQTFYLHQILCQSFSNHSGSIAHSCLVHLLLHLHNFPSNGFNSKGKEGTLIRFSVWKFCKKILGRLNRKYFLSRVSKSLNNMPKLDSDQIQHENL